MPSAGPLVMRQWVSTVDERTTVICLHAAGMLRTTEEPFDILGIGKLDHPPAHIHCRSLIVPWLPGFVNDTRRLANEELQRRPIAQRRIGPDGEIGARIPPPPADGLARPGKSAPRPVVPVRRPNRRGRIVRALIRRIARIRLRRR